MKLISKLTSLVAGVTLSATPVAAKIDADTPALLRALPAYGVNVALNHSDCKGQTQFHGYYNTGDKTFVVCYSGVPDANDHDTVRHEAMHVAQHCKAQREGNPMGISPILRKPELKEFAEMVLTDKEIIGIKSAYPREKWLTEFEAFAGAKIYTSAQVAHIVKTWCSGIPA